MRKLKNFIKFIVIFVLAKFLLDGIFLYITGKTLTSIVVALFKDLV
ncbi:MAG: hypothetical protein Q4B52_07780 [Tissierellia bacterium]|nr:hypothetical protein [Tissierellia bacterium]